MSNTEAPQNTPGQKMRVPRSLIVMYSFITIIMVGSIVSMTHSLAKDFAPRETVLQFDQRYNMYYSVTKKVGPTFYSYVMGLSATIGMYVLILLVLATVGAIGFIAWRVSLPRLRTEADEATPAPSESADS